jgi:Rod binding domain-containing protein
MTNVSPISYPSQQTTPNKLDAKTLAKIDKTAQDFEAVFISEMLKPMMETIEVDPQFGGGKGEEVFRGLLLNEYGKIISNQGGIGVAEQVKAQLIRLQEASQNTLQATGLPDAKLLETNIAKQLNDIAPQSGFSSVE